MRAHLFLPVLLTACFSADDAQLFEMGENPGGWFLEPVPQAIEAESSEYAARSATYAEAHGVVTLDNDEAWVGMGSMSCSIDTTTGYIAMDLDPDWTDQEEVTDGNADVVVSTTPGRVQLIDITEGNWVTLRVPGVVDARVGDDDDDLIILIDDPKDHCIVVFGSRVGAPYATLPDEGCAGGDAMTVDPAGPDVYISTDDGVEHITPEGRRTWDIEGGLLAWDGEAGLLYAAKKGGSTVRAYDAEGNLLWEVSVDGSVQRIRDMGAKGGVAVLVQAPDGSFRVYWIDASTGEITEAMATFTEISDIDVSPSGDDLSVVSQGQVDFFSLR